MKKILVVSVLILALLVAGCRERIVIVPGGGGMAAIDSLVAGLSSIAEPVDSGVTITISGFPDDSLVPEGFTGVNVYVDTVTLSGTPDSLLPAPVRTGITGETTFTVEDLKNGDLYMYEVRGQSGASISGYGFGGGFYPRPGGFGEYLGYDPNKDTSTVDSNGIIFDRETGHQGAEKAGANTDYYCYFNLADTGFYMTNAV